MSFNPLPQPELGEINRAHTPALNISLFQSAPPTRVRGDFVRAVPARALVWFQSAPPTRVRGDRVHDTAHEKVHHVSIRSPNQS